MNKKAQSTLKKFENILRFRNYSEQTIRTYLSYVKEFLNHFDKDVYHIPVKDAREWLENYNYSSVSKQNQIISAVKRLYKDVVGSKLTNLKITRPRREKPLPRLMDYDLTVKQIKAIKNKKHKAILWLALSTGMRVSELINLKIKDVDSKRMVVNVRKAKGRKDRIAPLTESTLVVLREYFKEYRPNEYLFNGFKSLKYSSTSVNCIVKKYTLKSNHIHLFRHLAFSRMVDTGTDISVVQKIAGHSRPETTSNTYLHLSNRTFKQIQPVI